MRPDQVPLTPKIARSLKDSMASPLQILFNDAPGSTRKKIIAIYSILFGFNLAAWAWALVAFHHYPVLLGTAFLAYSFGLRHAVDADHIAAIDNVTRKLMQEGKRPVAVGFMFSLGHSTVVVVGSIAIAATALALQHRIDAAKEIGGGHRHLGLDPLPVRHCDRKPDRPALDLPRPFCGFDAASPMWTKISTSCSTAAAFSPVSSGPSSA